MSYVNLEALIKREDLFIINDKNDGGAKFSIDKIYFENLHLKGNSIYEFLKNLGYKITEKIGTYGWCSLAEKKCREEEPPLFKLSENHLSRCWKSDQIEKQDSRTKISTFLVGNQKKFSDDYLLNVKNLSLIHI